MADTVIHQVVTGDHNLVTVSGDIQIHYELPPVEARMRRLLPILIDKVEALWIAGVLQRTIHTESLIELDMESRPEAVEHPLERVLLVPDQTGRIVEQAKKIGEVFDEVGRAMLILGDPGSGKTVTMLQLARELLKKARDNPNLAVPVVFNLSTWTPERGGLLDWLTVELGSKYQVSTQLGRCWLEDSRIVLLLDGLDEVRADQRAACVEAINAFTKETGVPGVIVCSRLNEYVVLPVRLRLNAALYLQPLRLSQIDAYVTAWGPRLAALKVLIRQDPSMQTLAQSPLMLSFMSVAFRDLSCKDLETAEAPSVEERRNQLFALYRGCMFNRLGKSKQPYSTQQVEEGLSWLAQQLARHYKNLFLIEEMQPSWLFSTKQRWIYALLSRMLAGFVMGVAFALVLAASEGYARGAAVGMSEGVVAGALVGLAEAFRMRRLENRSPSSAAHASWWRAPFSVLVLGIVAAIPLCAIEAPLFLARKGAFQWVIEGLLGGVVFGALFGLRGPHRTFSNDIRTMESLRWSWPSALRGGMWGMACGLIVALTVGVVAKLIDTLSLAMKAGSLSASIGALIGATWGGLQGLTIEAKSSPNQGIMRSARNAVLTGALVCLAVELAFAICCSWSLGLALEPLASGKPFALLLGFSAALWHGGLDTIQHYSLRLLLSFEGRIPLDCTRFLDHATRLAFLQRVGGGYQFIHTALRDHFAGLARREAAG